MDKIDRNLLTKINSLSLESCENCFIFYDNKNKINSCLEDLHIKEMYNYTFINAVYCLATREQILKASQYEEVKYIASRAYATSQMFVAKNILALSTSFSGEGVNVAFIDTGIAPHGDFVLGDNRIKLFKDFINSKTIPYDDNGHGTFVAGVCSGNGVLSKFKYSGIAPKSNLFVLKSLNSDGEGTANKILDAMEWIFDNHIKENIQVVCMSFGSEPVGTNDPIMKGANALWEDGVVVVTAAGNSGPEIGSIKSPGISSEIITVGGFDDNRYDNNSYNPDFFEIAYFSSRGPAFSYPKPDVVAPSVDIVSCNTSGGYSTLSGTSVATPMIAGIACLLLEKNKEYSPKEIKNIIKKNSISLGSDINAEGYGYPNIEKILF